MTHDEMVRQIALVCETYTDDTIAATGATQLILGIVKQREDAMRAELQAAQTEARRWQLVFNKTREQFRAARERGATLESHIAALESERWEEIALSMATSIFCGTAQSIYAGCETSAHVIHVARERVESERKRKEEHECNATNQHHGRD